MPLLRPYTRARMNRVAGASLTLCNVLYIVMALSCVLTFGADVDADVLTNMNADGLSPLVGPVAAVLIAYVVRLLFLLSLVGSYAMAMHPLRHCVLEVILGKRYHQLHRAEEHALFVPLTVALLVAIWATAVLVPGIWLVVSSSVETTTPLLTKM